MKAQTNANKNKVRIVVEVDGELENKLKNEARANGLTLSSMIRFIFSSYLKGRK